MRRLVLTCYVGRFRVPRWLYRALPDWAHRAANWLGGVEPSPWLELRDRLRRTKP